MQRSIMRIVAMAAICAIALVGARRDRAGAAQPDDWPMYLHDISHTSANHVDTTISPASASRLSRAWSFTTGGAVAAAPTVSDGLVFVGSWDGYMYALDANSGQLKWKTYLGITDATGFCDTPEKAGITSAATVDTNVVYVAGGDSYFYALDEQTGAVLWQTFIGDNSTTSGHYNWSSPLIYNGFAYYGVASFCDQPLVQGQVLRINLTTHLIDGTFNVVPNTQVGGGVWGSPTIDPASNTVFFTTGNEDPYASLPEPLARSVVAIDATTMKLKKHWQSPFGVNADGDWGTTPVLFTDVHGLQLVTASSKDGNVYAFNRSNLAAGPVWNTQIAMSGWDPLLGHGSISSSAFDGTTLYAAGGHFTLDGVMVPGTVAALDPTTGNLIWQRAAPGIVFGATAWANGVLVDGGGTNVEVSSAATGSVLYSYTTAGPIYGPPTIAEGHVFEGSTDGTVYAFAPPSSVGGFAEAVDPGTLPARPGGNLGRYAAIFAVAALLLAACGLTLRRRHGSV